MEVSEMMPVIRVSQDTWERLKTWAVPLEDKPDDVLRRVLDAADRQRAGTSSPALVRPSPHVSRIRGGASKREGWQRKDDLYRAIVETLREMGGRGHVDEIIPRVKAKIPQLLNEYYTAADPGGMERWLHATHAARMKLVEKGVLRQGSPRGVWELAPNATEWPRR